MQIRIFINAVKEAEPRWIAPSKCNAYFSDVSYNFMYYVCPVLFYVFKVLANA